MTKIYTVEFDDKVAEEIDEVAETTAKVPSPALIELLVIKALAPWYRGEVVKETKEVEDE